MLQKHKKRSSVFAALAIMLIAMSISTSALANETTRLHIEINESLFKHFNETISSNQLRSLELFEQFQNLLSEYSRSRGSADPDFFGGAYLDELGNLVILIVEDFLPEDFHANELIASFSSDTVSFRFVDLPRSTLEEIKQEAVAAASSKFDTATCIYSDNATTIGIDEIQNRVRIRLEVLSNEKIAGFRENVFDSPFIFFEQGYRITREGFNHSFWEKNTHILPIAITILATALIIIFTIKIIKKLRKIM